MDSRVDPQIQLAPAIMDRPTQLRHGCRFVDVHRGQRCRAAFGFDRVIQIFKAANGAADRNHVTRRRQAPQHRQNQDRAMRR